MNLPLGVIFPFLFKCCVGRFVNGRIVLKDVKRFIKILFSRVVYVWVAFRGREES